MSTRVEHLTEGDTFFAPFSRISGVFLYSTPCASLVIMDGKREQIANSVQVNVTGRVKLTKNQDNLLVIAHATTPEPNKVKEVKVKSGNGKRGRAPNLDKKPSIKIPKGKFRIKECAESNEVEPYVVTNELNRLVKLKVIKLEVVGHEKSSSGRGKPTNILKVTFLK